MCGISRSLRQLRLGRAVPVLCVLAILASACSGGSDGVADSAPTTEQPRQIAEPSTTTTTTTTTTTEPPPPPVAHIHVLGSMRVVPDSATQNAEEVDEEAVDDIAESAEPAESAGVAGPATAPVLVGDDATIASLGCTRSSGCEPTDLAAWAANTLDVINLATAAAGADGGAIVAELQDALTAGGVATAGYGADLASALEPAIAGNPDLPVAIFGISLAEGLPPETVATETTAGIAAGAEAFAQLVESIASAGSTDQRTVVILDFGRLEDRAPAEDITERVQLLVEAGADAVIIHGSDFLQRFERIDETSVAFGLGNAVTATAEPLRRDTAILRLTFEQVTKNACLFPATGSETGVGMDDPTLIDCP